MDEPSGSYALTFTLAIGMPRDADYRKKDVEAHFENDDLWAATGEADTILMEYREANPRWSELEDIHLIDRDGGAVVATLDAARDDWAMVERDPVIAADRANRLLAVKGGTMQVQVEADRLLELIEAGTYDAAYALATALQQRLFEIGYSLRMLKA
jgi:hypothetical protein